MSWHHHYENGKQVAPDYALDPDQNPKKDLHWKANLEGDWQTYNTESKLEHLFHDNYVEGRRMRNGGGVAVEEWIPNMLPASVRQAQEAGVQYYGDQTDQPEPQPRNTVGDETNLFSGDADGATSVTEHEEDENNASHENSTRQELPATSQSQSIRIIRPLHHTSVFGPRITQRTSTLTITAGQEMAGRGRGRGGGGAGSGMLKGATWEYDASIKLESKPTDLFPPHPNLKRPAPLTEKERREINNYKNLVDKVHRGPLYTQPTKRDPNAPAKTFGEEQFNRQYGTNRKADMDPFNGVETYSMRYAPKQRDLPKLSDQPFDKSLFPEELWATLEGTEGQEVRNHINRAMQRKAALLDGKDTSLKTRLVLEKIHNVTGDEDNEELDEEGKDEEIDDEYDDDEIGDDYNGEQYFDNGEDEFEEDGDGGGEDY